MEFPRLDGDTSFPELDSVNVFKYRNEIDYSRFERAQMRIRVLSVPWDQGELHVGQRSISGHGNVVKFDDDEARDAWFDSRRYATTPDEWASEGFSAFDGLEWVTRFRKYHAEDVIRIPLPFDVVSRLNYIAIRYQPVPGADDPLSWEAGGMLDYFYFIRDFKSLAPNVTECEIMLDGWQTYINHVRIPYMMLSRGHAPVWASDVDTYLENPIEGSSWILEDEGHGSEPSVVRGARECVLNSGEMMAVVIMTGDIRATWGAMGDYTARTPGGLHVQDGVLAPYAWAVEAQDIGLALITLESERPQALATIQAVAFVDKRLIRLGTTFAIGSVEAHEVSGGGATLDLIELDRTMFDFPERYADLAKLYTWPYSALEVVDGSGESHLVRVEDTSGSLKVDASVSLAFPFLTLDSRVTGVGGSVTRSLTFGNIDRRTITLSGSWWELQRRHEIPTFSIQQSAEAKREWEALYDNRQRERQAQASHDNAIESATVSKANADASADTAKANADRSAVAALNNANASADTVKANADRDALTAKTNSDRNADTAKANADRSADTQELTARRSSTTAKANADRSAAAQKNMQDLDADTMVSNSDAQQLSNTNQNAWRNSNVSHTETEDNNFNTLNTALSNNYITITTQTEITRDQQMQAIDTASAAIGTGAQMAVEGAAAGPIGAVAGFVGGAIMGALSTGPAIAKTMVGANFQTSQADNTKSQNSQSETLSNAITSSKAAMSRSLNTNSNSIANALIATTAANNAATAKANAATAKSTSDSNSTATDATTRQNAVSLQDTSKTNASASQVSAKANANDSYDTATTDSAASQATDKANAARTYDASVANSSASQAVDKANATRTYNASVANANRSLAVARQGITSDDNQASLEPPSVYGVANAGETATTRPEALMCYVRTQRPDEIRRAGDDFVRYGYRCSGIWDFETFNLMSHFTYWKCEEISIEDADVPDGHMDAIQMLLMGGVTVWRDPASIGKISPYLNRPIREASNG